MSDLTFTNARLIDPEAGTDTLGWAVAQVMALVDPDIVVIGGGVAGMSAALDAAKAGYPVTIVEKREIKRLIGMDFIVICCGGGGIPVKREGRAFQGVDAVIEQGYIEADS